MVMEYLKNKAKSKPSTNETMLPDWVSKSNSSFKAWQYVEELKKEKSLYIKRHHKVTDFLTKKTYQIKGSDIAKALSISRASLMNTSSYSESFRQYLEMVNAELEDAKIAKLKNTSQSASRGSIRSRKDELMAINSELKKQLSALERQKTEELVSHAYDQLPLNIKRKLGLA
jgi:hypothetical protein